MSKTEDKEKEDIKEQQQDVAEEKVKTEGVKNEETADKAAAEEKTQESESDKLQKKLDEANAKNAELTDKLLRLHAEFDNYKKRNLKEKAELIKNGGERAIESFLPVIDDFERALDVMSKSDDRNAVKEGVKLIYEKFVTILHKNGVTEIETKGLALDTDIHEAIATIPAPSESEKGKIVDCVQTGYRLNDKVLRHAKVVVAQ